MLLRSLPIYILHQCEQAAGIADQLVQEADHVAKPWSSTAFLLPAEKHELVQGHGAAHGRREPVALLYRQNYLQNTDTQNLTGIQILQDHFINAILGMPFVVQHEIL